MDVSSAVSCADDVSAGDATVLLLQTSVDDSRADSDDLSVSDTVAVSVKDDVGWDTVLDPQASDVDSALDVVIVSAVSMEVDDDSAICVVPSLLLDSIPDESIDGWLLEVATASNDDPPLAAGVVDPAASDADCVCTVPETIVSVAEPAV